MKKKNQHLHLALGIGGRVAVARLIQGRRNWMPDQEGFLLNTYNSEFG